MGEDELVDCPVEVGPEHQLGAYANAFRVRRTTKGEHILDFLLYSEVENAAKVVSRVRIPDAFVPQMEARLGTAFRDFEGVADTKPISSV
jgi:hypothetical protein